MLFRNVVHEMLTQKVVAKLGRADKNIREMLRSTSKLLEATSFGGIETTKIKEFIGI